MIKKFFAWVKALFVPAKIEDVKVDEYIVKQSQNPEWERHITKNSGTETQVRFSKSEDRPATEPLEKDEVVVGVCVGSDGTMETSAVKVVKVEEVVKVASTPPKPLNEQLKGVELPSYAKGKTLPPKAKRQYIAQAKRPAQSRRLDDTPHSTGAHVTTHGTDPASAALYGYAAGAFMADDNRSSHSSPVEECRSSAAISTYSSSYSSSSDDNHTSSNYGSSSSSSYDSSSYDSGSTSSSCD